MDSLEALKDATELYWDTAIRRRAELAGRAVRGEITPTERAELHCLDAASTACVRWLEVTSE